MSSSAMRGRGLVLALGLVGWACAPKVPAELEPVEAQAQTQPQATPAVVAEPDAGASPEGEPAGSSGALEAVTGIPECDAYLDLYQRCETRLEPEIMAGDRRFYKAERAQLEVLAQSPEAPSLPAACTQMLAELTPICG